MGETGPGQPTTFHDTNQLHNFSMTSLIPEEERVGPAGSGFSKRERNKYNGKKRRKNKKTNW